MFSNILQNLIQFVKHSHDDEKEFVPTAALLTGVNMPDHAAQFSSLYKQIKQTVTPHVACLYTQDCQNIKSLVENMMDQFINMDYDSIDEVSNIIKNIVHSLKHLFQDKMVTEELPSYIKKSNMNISLLQCWYDTCYKENTLQSPKKLRIKNTRKNLVVIFPEFETLNPDVLQKFLLITSGRILSLPFVIIFGMATSINTLTNSLPYKVMSKISIKVFHSQPSSIYLNQVLENIFFNLSFPFHLGGKVFNLFMDIFLFYDLSVTNFIQNIKVSAINSFTFFLHL